MDIKNELLSSFLVGNAIKYKLDIAPGKVYFRSNFKIFFE